ncbi:MAG: GNAT family N-acetyltransferase [Planctomycetota bacterium]|jgi:ribosomal protein S18 acetylase RimI-like enzyme|nr:GNAT family N-acetyltransferase [Planctomycetota bacterium]
MDLFFRDCPGQTDIPAVRGLLAGTGFFRADEMDVATELVAERLAKGSASGYYFYFAEEDGELAGYVCFGPIPCAIGSFDLYWVAVDKRRQGRGLGLRLVEKCEESARNMGGRRVFIETSGKPQYLPTRRFYRRAGYVEAARLKDFYGQGDDKIVYRKDFHL